MKQYLTGYGSIYYKEDILWKHENQGTITTSRRLTYRVVVVNVI